MKSFIKFLVIVLVLVSFTSCFNRNSRNYQYMPNMYQSVGYETYQKVDFLPSGMEAGIPVENTIARGHMPYKYANTPEGKELSKVQPSPLDSINTEANLKVGGELYDIYCAICHGTKGNGKGTLVDREKILGVPSYDDAGRAITVGDAYHTIYYGLNSMGSYANQLNEKERWQVSEYVMKLKQDLTK